MDRMSSSSTPDALFDGTPEPEVVVASYEVPPIPGLWVFPHLLPQESADTAISELGEQDFFAGGSRDQVMLFTRPPPSPSSLPLFLKRLIDVTSNLLRPLLPSGTHDTVFKQDLARQVILNLYSPGQGITPHIDLPNRYADGIVGVSLIGGCVMTFQRGEERYDVYLPARMVYAVTGEARWEWTHGIEGRMEDLVKGPEGVETKLRSTRVSVTFRWMQEGADTLS